MLNRDDHVRRQKEDLEKRPHLTKFICFNNHEDIVNFINLYKQEKAILNYVKGPEVVEIRNL